MPEKKQGKNSVNMLFNIVSLVYGYWKVILKKKQFKSSIKPTIAERFEMPCQIIIGYEWLPRILKDD